MSVSPDELTIIANDGRGLSQVDRESIREAANDLETMFNLYHRLRLDFVELERANAAQAERIKELTRKKVEYDVLRVTMGFYLLPSWARFPNV